MLTLWRSSAPKTLSVIPGISLTPSPHQRDERHLLTSRESHHRYRDFVVARGDQPEVVNDDDRFDSPGPTIRTCNLGAGPFGHEAVANPDRGFPVRQRFESVGMKPLRAKARQFGCFPVRDFAERACFRHQARVGAQHAVNVSPKNDLDGVERCSKDRGCVIGDAAPRVVVPPCAVAPVKPATIGMKPSSIKGINRERTRSHVSAIKGSACPNASSVTISSVASMTTPWGHSAQETRRDESLSPTLAMTSRADGVNSRDAATP